MDPSDRTPGSHRSRTEAGKIYLDVVDRLNDVPTKWRRVRRLRRSVVTFFAILVATGVSGMARLRGASRRLPSLARSSLRPWPGALIGGVQAARLVASRTGQALGARLSGIRRRLPAVAKLRESAAPVIARGLASVRNAGAALSSAGKARIRQTVGRLDEDGSRAARLASRAHQEVAVRVRAALREIRRLRERAPAVVARGVATVRKTGAALTSAAQSSGGRAEWHLGDGWVPWSRVLAFGAAILALTLAVPRWRTPPPEVQLLWNPAVTDDLKLPAIERLARDPSRRATDVLLTTVDHPSLLVSMASIRALRDRPCHLVTRALERQLSDPAWQRRAWAAKVVAENGCTAAARPMEARLASESDARVQQQLVGALETLQGLR